MTAYYNDLKLFFQRAGAFPSNTRRAPRRARHVGLHAAARHERQRRHRAGEGRPRPASPSSPACRTTSRASRRPIEQLRDHYAPNVLLGYHLSIWGTGNDIIYSDPSDAHGRRARRPRCQLLPLAADADSTSRSPSSATATPAFKQYEYGDGGASWWDAADFARHVRFLTKFTRGRPEAHRAVADPLGNTKMRAMNNTWNHYQDNHVEWLLDEPARTHLHALRQRRRGRLPLRPRRGRRDLRLRRQRRRRDEPGADQRQQHACRCNADDDGGFFKDRANAYLRSGAMPLPSSQAGIAHRPGGS